MDHSPLIHKVTNLFKHTNLNIAFHATITIYKQLSDKIIIIIIIIIKTKQILVG